ncbi:hypothetical protein B0G52_104113 [Cohnella sp. SGD-V74]|nr:hypothetical protein B0G52_104113 [Cohnella sp. SGD-V74]
MSGLSGPFMPFMYVRQNASNRVRRSAPSTKSCLDGCKRGELT